VKYFLLFLILISEVFAIGISPGSLDLEADRGEIIQKDYYLYNTQEEDKEFRIFVEGFDWFSFYPNNIKIEPNSKAKIRIILEIPSNISSGIYVGKIYFKEKIDNALNINPGVIIPYNLSVDGDLISYSELDQRVIYHSAMVFEQEVKETIKKEKIKLETTLFVILGIIVIILLAFVVKRFIRITKGL